MNVRLVQNLDGKPVCKPDVAGTTPTSHPSSDSAAANDPMNAATSLRDKSIDTRALFASKLISTPGFPFDGTATRMASDLLSCIHVLHYESTDLQNFPQSHVAVSLAQPMDKGRVTRDHHAKFRRSNACLGDELVYKERYILHRRNQHLGITLNP
jgi:hypothetical protein